MSPLATGYNPGGFGEASVAPSTAAPTFALPATTPQQAAYMATLQHAQQVIKNKETGAFGGYRFKPDKVKFSTQNPREQVFILLRAHPITNFGWIFRSIITLFIPFVVVGILAAINFNVGNIIPLNSFNAELSLNRVGVVILISYYSLAFTSAIINFIDWYYDLYLVTNERIVDYSFRPLVSYEILEARLENIENVKEKSIGFIPSLFGYGDIMVRTAGSDVEFSFSAVPRPSQVRDIITELSSFTKRVYGHFRGNN